MILLKKQFIASIFMLTTLSLISQQELEKIKAKNLIGEWYSKDPFKSQQNSTMTFFKKPNESIKDSLISNFKFNKNETLRIITLKKTAALEDTVFTTWYFVEASKNVKITQKIKTGAGLTVKMANGNNSEGGFFMTRVYSFHVDFISEDKLVLRYQEFH